MKNSAFEDFNESALEALDFARCQRPDGSYYGTGGQCRKGTPVGAKEITTSDMKKFAAEVSAYNTGDGIVFDEGSEPPVPVEKMSQKQLNAYVKEAIQISYGPETDLIEITMENMAMDNPKLAAKFEAAIERNGGTLPVNSVKAEKYYHDGDKSKHPSIRGTINGIKFEMPEVSQQLKSEGNGDYAMYLAPSYDIR